MTAGFRPNPGYCPAEAEGRRARVILVNGQEYEWPADGRHGCDWTPADQWPASLRPFAIAEYQPR